MLKFDTTADLVTALSSPVPVIGRDGTLFADVKSELAYVADAVQSAYIGLVRAMMRDLPDTPGAERKAERAARALIVSEALRELDRQLDVAEDVRVTV